MKRRKHIACKVGDHSGAPPRDIAPGKTPVTLFNSNGKVWFVSDQDARLIQAARRRARQEGVRTNILLSRVIVEGFTRLVEGGAL